MKGTVTPGMTGNDLKTLTQMFLYGFLRREIIYFKYLYPDFFYMAFFTVVAWLIWLPRDPSLIKGLLASQQRIVDYHVKRVSQRSAEVVNFFQMLRFPPTGKVDRI